VIPVHLNSTSSDVAWSWLTADV